MRSRVPVAVAVAIALFVPAAGGECWSGRECNFDNRPGAADAFAKEDVPVLVELRAMVPGITLLASSDRFGRFGCQRAQELVGAEQFCH